MLGHNGAILRHNTKWLGEAVTPPVPPTPVPLPARTLRVRYRPGTVPTPDPNYSSLQDCTITPVSGMTDVYDVTTNTASWNNLFMSQFDLLEVIEANSTDIVELSNIFNRCYYLTSVPLFDTSNITEMEYMFRNCQSLVSLPLFNTSNVTSMHSMCEGCLALTSIPLLDTSKCVHMNFAFYDCRRVESGALALYTQASTQATPPVYHNDTFYRCGDLTTTGYAELQQIDPDWK